LASDAETEKRAPQISSSEVISHNDKESKFPQYNENEGFEAIPGSQKTNKCINDQEKVSPLHGTPYPD
jgi:hypothetical protein